ncbi:YcnI family protein [Phytohabitans sp. ZYX-F-186]|uniref:YcnI family protein n=1 Tax=Phytohabitans maris TaxID=3071409 RepID=A0ABU0ZCC7_9ACTN|nr:YcnI family protein [Phytohabitans sp. ZYX-F-186]MDQ7904707.1 YcnI family protein [Phytohabitans sp. ZYX-F-186]
MKRVALVLGAAVTFLLAVAAPAAAHVTVNPQEAEKGGFARLAFRVPNESDTASTVKLEVVLPENAPVGSVSIMPVAGWTATVERRKVDPPVDVHGSQVSEVVSKITWTAPAGGGVKPGEFVEFPVSMGPLPDVDRMVFKALQTYSDNEVSRWIEEPQPGAEEPEEPAPVLALVSAAAADPTSAPDAAAPSTEDDDGGDGLAVILAVVALVAGLGGLVLGGLAFVRSRKAS